jgi:hypothetical protein
MHLKDRLVERPLSTGRTLELQAANQNFTRFTDIHLNPWGENDKENLPQRHQGTKRVKRQS